MLSYWLMVELISVWGKPLDRLSYTLFITLSFLVVHAAILAGFIWVLIVIVRIIKVAMSVIILPFRFLWHVSSLTFEKTSSLLNFTSAKTRQIMRKVR